MLTREFPPNLPVLMRPFGKLQIKRAYEPGNSGASILAGRWFESLSNSLDDLVQLVARETGEAEGP